MNQNFTWGANVIVPDLAGWKKERLPKLPDTAYFELAPNWVCETLSPSTAKYDKIVKLRIYAENSVPYYWITDPINKTVDVLVLEDGSYKLAATFGGDDKISAPPFEAMEFDLGDLWKRE